MLSSYESTCVCGSFLLLALPLAAQTPAAGAPAAPATATKTAPPAGFTKRLCCGRTARRAALGTTDGDVPKLFTYPTAGPGPHPSRDRDARRRLYAPGDGAGRRTRGALAGRAWRRRVCAGVQAGAGVLYPTQSKDVSRAIRYVRSHAAELGVKPDAIGVWGFSAGGSLAGYVGDDSQRGRSAAADPMDRVSDRPDFEIVSYGGWT